MNLLNLMRCRRSIRKYTDKEIPPEVLERILEAGLLAPSSRNYRPWEFYTVTSKPVLKSLSASKASGASMLSNAAAAIAVFADSDKADTWVEDCSIAMTYMMLAAQAEDLGSCWVQIHLRQAESGENAEDKVRSILHADPNLRCVGILSLGFPAQQLPPRSIEELSRDNLHFL